MLNYTLSFPFIYWSMWGRRGVRSKEPEELRKPGTMFTRPVDKYKHGTNNSNEFFLLHCGNLLQCLIQALRYVTQLEK